MLKRLFRSSAAIAATAPAVPPNTRVYAIGDVHGCRAELDALLAAIDADVAARPPVAATTTLFLGDLVDRGPDSAGVVACAMERAASDPGFRFIKGNHEEIFLLAMAGDREALKLFCRVGGRETSLSYGIGGAAYDAMDYDELAAALVAAVPESHRAFLDGFEDVVAIGDYAFVHAGIRPGVTLEAQRSADLRWIRRPFLDHAGGFPATIVHGHTVTDEVDRARDRIGIDTGAYRTGRLTAMGFEGTAQWIIATPGPNSSQ